MKKLLIGMLVLGSFSAMSAEVLILKTAAKGRAGNDYRVYPFSGNLIDVAKSKSINACEDLNGEVIKTKCDETWVHGYKAFMWSQAAACVTVCRID